MEWSNLVASLETLAPTWPVTKNEPKLFVENTHIKVGQLTSYIQTLSFVKWAICRLLIRYPRRFKLRRNGQMCFPPESMFLLDAGVGGGQKIGQYANVTDYPSDEETRLSIAESIFPFPFIDYTNGVVWVKYNSLHVNSADPEQVHWPRMLEYEGANIVFDLRDGEQLDQMLNDSLARRANAVMAGRSEKERMCIELIVSLYKNEDGSRVASRVLKAKLEERLGEKIPYANYADFRKAAAEIDAEVSSVGRPRATEQEK